jgi:hypothetical protein
MRCYGITARCLFPAKSSLRRRAFLIRSSKPSPRVSHWSKLCIRGIRLHRPNPPQATTAIGEMARLVKSPKALLVASRCCPQCPYCATEELAANIALFNDMRVLDFDQRLFAPNRVGSSFARWAGEHPPGDSKVCRRPCRCGVTNSRYSYLTKSHLLP